MKNTNEMNEFVNRNSLVEGQSKSSRRTTLNSQLSTFTSRLSTLVLIVFCLFFGGKAWGQTTVAIGDGTSTGYYCPIGTYYNYSITEQLYTADEIGMAGAISSISFYWAYTTAKNFEIEVYIKEVNAANLSTGISLSDATLVFNGTLSVPATAGWVTIDIDDFEYSGNDNLLIGINKTGGSSWFSGSTWRYTSTSNMARYTQNDNNEYTTSTTPGSVTNNRPNIQLEITPASVSCSSPDAILASSITSNGASLSWSGGSGTYNVEYKKTSDADWSTLLSGTTQTSTTLSTLDPNTGYQVRVQSVCSGENSTYRSTSFRTACGTITSFPWSETFESYADGNFTDPCWVNEHISGGGSDIFKVYTSTNGTNSTHQLQLPDMSIGTLTKLVLPEMNFGAVSTQYQFVIDVYRSSSTYNDSYPNEGIRIYASTNGEIEGANEIAFIPRHYNVSNNVIPVESAEGWYTYELNIPITTGTCYIIIRGESQYCTATYMDNFEVKVAPSCTKPTGLTAGTPTAHAVTLNWTENGSATNWVLEYGTASDFAGATSVNVSGTPSKNLTGLTAETTYYVRVKADCGGGDVSEWITQSFTTDIACPVPTGLSATFTPGNGTIATLTWTEEGSATDWVLEYGTASDFTGATSVDVSGTPSASLTGLTAETTYYARVKADCGDTDGKSAWSTTFTFEPTAKTIIGTAESTSGYLPTNTNYDYSYTQQIYTSAELGDAGAIQSIDFYMLTTAYTRSLDIYMVNTTKNSFSGTTDWIAVTDADKVFSGSVPFAADSWTTITLDTEFEYDGTSNLAIIVDDNTGEWSNRYFRTYTASETQSHYCYQDNTNISPSSPSASYNYTATTKNHIRILKTSPCPKPTNFHASAVDVNSVTVAWNPNGGTKWRIFWTTSDNTSWTNPNDSGIISPNDNTYTITGLVTGTTYMFMIYGYCGSDDIVEINNPSNYSASIVITATPSCPVPTNVHAGNLTQHTAQITWDGNADSYNVRYRTATITGTTLSPVFEDGFESGLTGWTTYANDYDAEGYTNWQTFDANQFDGESNHSGSASAMSRSWTSSTGDVSVDNWLVTPQITLGNTVKFWVATNAGFEDSYAVYVSTGSGVVPSSGTGDFEVIAGLTPATGTWVEHTYDLSAYAGQTGYVAIRHKDYAHDNLLIDDFGVYNTINSYSYGAWNNVSPSPTTTSCTITGLNAETLYEVSVQSSCGGNGTSDWTSIYFTTPDACSAPTDLVSSNITSTTATLGWADNQDSYNLRYRKIYFYEGFEGETLPTGWTTIDANDDGNTWSIGHATAHSGSNGACNFSFIYNTTGTTPNDWLVSPQLDLQGTLRVWLSGNGIAGNQYSEHFQIYVSTTGNSAGDFTTTLVGETITGNAYVEYTADLSSYAGQRGYIAIRHFNCTDQNYLYVDDFGLYGSDNWTTINPSDATASLSNLSADTEYEWQVQGINCNGGGALTSWSATSHFTTLCSIAASVSPDGAGSITGAGDYARGSTCTLTAPEDDCYTFVNWTDENDLEVSTNATYSFTVTGNRTLVANFTLNNYSVTVDAGEGGTASQEGNGTYDCGSTARLTATPDACHNFSYWTDGNGGTFAGFNPIEVTVDHDITFTAHFTLKTYTITTVASPNAGGSVTQSGNGTYNCGSDATLTATPSSGYYFYQWNDGNTDNPRTINNITSNATYTATFKQAPHTIANATDWNNFAEAVSRGYTYSGETVTQTADITVTTMVGGVNAAGVYDENFYFNGIFNGGCNTITFTKANATEQYIAPFRYINSATISNLKLTGTVSTTNKFAGGIVAHSTGASIITNCINSTYIEGKSGTPGNNGSHGGIIGQVGGGHSVTITGCVFNGTMTGNNGAITRWSGIMGYGNNVTADIRDCLFAPQSVSCGGYSYTICRTDDVSVNLTVSNCYYTQTMTNQQGTRAYSVTGGTGVEVSMQGSASTTYNCSGLNFYTSGLTFNGTIYGSSLALSLGYEGLISGYTTSNGELSGSSHTGVNDEYTLASLSGNAVINQNPCPFDNPPAGLIWKGGTAGDITNWAVATNWAVYNESESRYQLAGSAPSESSDVFIVSNDACNIVGVPSLSSNEECNDITLNGIGVNIADGKYLTVNGTATFTSGIVTGDVTFGSSAKVSGASTSSHVDGIVKKNGAAKSTDFYFPTGSNGNLGKVVVTDGTATNVSVQYFSNPAGFSVNDLPRWWASASVSGFDHVSNVEYWKISSTDTITANFIAEASTDMHFNSGTAEEDKIPTNIQMAFYDNNHWTNVGGSASIGNNMLTITGAVIPASTTRGISGNYTTFGSKTASTVLPIELTSFTATCDGRSAHVEWTTASERNNDYFSLERSDDAINFTEIARVAGAGNSIEPIDYAYNDYGIHGGDNYYRLVQVDYDGTRTVSEVIVANCIEPESDGEPEVVAYPNPFSSELTVVLDNFSNRAATIEVYDMLGKLIYTEKASAPQNSYETILNLSNLPSGAYTVRVSTTDFVINKNVVKN